MPHSRPATPSVEPSAKRTKTSHVSSAADAFHPGLLDKINAQALNKAYEQSKPYKYAIIDELFKEDFLRKARHDLGS
jgi:hypothetical protein